MARDVMTGVLNEICRFIDRSRDLPAQIELSEDDWYAAREEMCVWLHDRGEPPIPYALDEYAESHFLIRNIPAVIRQETNLGSP